MKQQIIEANPVKECHCGHIADKYFTRTFTNELGYEVVRIFYRCRNCLSRISQDFLPEIDALHKESVFDLLKKYN